MVQRRLQYSGVYRVKDREPQMPWFIPGGPFWARKDDGAWSIPKGLLEAGEDPLTAARRELAEETGCRPREGVHRARPLPRPGGKIISAWAVEGDFDRKDFNSNLFTIEWPPRSGRMREFPEADRADCLRRKTPCARSPRDKFRSSRLCWFGSAQGPCDPGLRGFAQADTGCCRCLGAVAPGVTDRLLDLCWGAEQLADAGDIARGAAGMTMDRR